MSELRGWTVSAASALAVLALIGGGAVAVDYLEPPAEQPQHEAPVKSDPATLLQISDEQVVITEAEPTPATAPASEPVAEPEPIEADAPAPADSPEPEPVAVEEPVMTPKPESSPSPSPSPVADLQVDPGQGSGPGAPPAEEGFRDHEEPGGHNQAPADY